MPAVTPQLYSFLEAAANACVGDGRLQGLLLTGLAERGCALLQGYVDRTGDVQTAALVGCFINGDSVPVSSARRVREWISAYRDLLNVWQLWHERARFDVGRAQLHGRRTKSSAPAFAREFAPSRGHAHVVSMRYGRGGKFGHNDAASMASTQTAGSEDNADMMGDGEVRAWGACVGVGAPLRRCNLTHVHIVAMHGHTGNRRSRPQ